jgi:hypothetical protein
MENKKACWPFGEQVGKNCFVGLGDFLLLAVAVSLLDEAPDGTRESRHGPIGYRAMRVCIAFTRYIHQARLPCLLIRGLSSLIKNIQFRVEFIVVWEGFR